MALTDYSIDTSGSPQDVQRKQALADALMKQGMDSSAAAGGKGGGWITALNRGLAGALGGYQAGAAQQEQTQGRQGFNQQLAAALGADGKINPQAYLQAASNPFANPAAIGAAGKVQDWQHTAEADAEHKREFGLNYGLQAAAGSRAAAAEARAKADFENTPDQYAKNPDFGKPGEPEFIDRYAQAKSGSGNTFSQEVEQRKKEAAGLGLTPADPRYASFVLANKFPREDAQPLTATDKKAILDAEEKLQSSKATIANLQQAKTLSPQAMSGPAASARGYVSSFLGNTSDIGKAGIATQDLENLTTTNALQSLKAVFGGNPTEGERAILLDIQGSVGKPDVVRQKIYDRAIEAANRRIAFEQQRVDELRGGSFYKPQGGLSKTPPGAASSAVPSDPVVIDGYTIKAR